MYNWRIDMEKTSDIVRRCMESVQESGGDASHLIFQYQIERLKEEISELRNSLATVATHCGKKFYRGIYVANI